MDKRHALRILIEHSFLLSQEVRQVLYHKVDQFNDAQVEALGQFLATEKVRSLSTIKEKITNLEKVLQDLNQYVATNEPKK